MQEDVNKARPSVAAISVTCQRRSRILYQDKEVLLTLQLSENLNINVKLYIRVKVLKRSNTGLQKVRIHSCIYCVGLVIY